MIPDIYDRKLGFGETFSVSWKVFYSNIKYILVFSLVAGLLVRVADYLLFSVLPETDNLMVEAYSKNILGSLFGYLFGVFSITIVERFVNGLTVCWTVLFESLRKYFWLAFWVHLIESVLMFLSRAPRIVSWGADSSPSWLVFLEFAGMFAFIAMTVCFYFTMQAVVLRDQRGFKAICYSCRVVKGRWWLLFGYSIILSIVIGIFLFCFTFPLSRVLNCPVSDVAYWAYPVSSVLGSYIMVFFTVIFLNVDRD
ncbi:MAG: hypothetical protein ISR85_04545 [Kiritimatiellales bacterium]|nr:hypothetical protein [Kiritimatiellota bacterium]MBL7012179.1 hypothetical protein [Kiritimatiellales bacterium]